MSNSYFRFKQFTVWHNRCAMKVGTDGVLLGAWCRVDAAKRILDIGTGTGLVALMVAQRSSALVTALEIDRDAFVQAKENCAKSPWKERIEVIHTDFREYRPGNKFDCIVSNPPYFANSLECPGEQRTLARHGNELSYYELLQGVSVLLAKSGEFTIILPSEVSEKMKEIAEEYHLYPCRQMNIITSPGKLPKRSLMTFSFSGFPVCSPQEMLIEEKRHQYSEEYIALTKDYYLNM